MPSAETRRRISLYGCGVVAPGASHLKEFLQKVETQTPTLTPFGEFFDAFLVGEPQFRFSDYESWISERHAPSRYSQLNEKGGVNVKYAVGALVDALEGNPGLERALKRMDPRVYICVGGGFTDLSEAFRASRDYERAARHWNAFWAAPERNEVCRAHRASGTHPASTVPADPLTLPTDSEERFEAWGHWNRFWAERNPRLHAFLDEFLAIENTKVGSDVANDKLNLIRAKARAKKALLEKYGCPPPPWECVSPNLLWNLPNAPAAQISMLLGMHGAGLATNAACATFGAVVKQAMDAIRSGEYDAAIVGTSDNPPTPELVAGFYAAKVLAAGREVSVPLTHMRGTHISGGACLWVIAAEDAMAKHEVPTLGVDVLGAGLSSDAEHIITPSHEGPKLAIRNALQHANLDPVEIMSWDMHATGTPGDWSEFGLIEEFVGPEAVLTARKGLFGHGMGTCGGWEATAQVLTMKSKDDAVLEVAPSGIPDGEVHPRIHGLGRRLATSAPAELRVPSGSAVCGKLSMGIGGISSCLLTRVHSKQKNA